MWFFFDFHRASQYKCARSFVRSFGRFAWNIGSAKSQNDEKMVFVCVCVGVLVWRNRMKWNEMEWISSAVVQPKINLICVNVRFCADINRRHLNKLFAHHLDADAASVQLSSIHKNVTRHDVDASAVSTHFYPPTKIPTQNIQIATTIDRSISTAWYSTVFLTAQANQLNKSHAFAHYLFVWTFFFCYKIKYLSHSFARFEKSKMKEIWFRRSEGKNIIKKIADITVQQMLFEKFQKSTNKHLCNEHNEISEIFYRNVFDQARINILNNMEISDTQREKNGDFFIDSPKKIPSTDEF